MMDKADWIILRVLVAAMRSEAAGKLTRNKDIVQTVLYLQKKYGQKQFFKCIDAIHEEYAK